MSDKLTALPTEVTIDDADLLYFVDVSDTTDDPAGSSKAIAKSNLVTPPPSALDDLTDVDLTTTPPINTDVLTYDGTDWVPAAPAGGGGSVAMTDITDTDLTTTPPVADDFLKFDGTNWVPAVPAGGGGGGGGTIDLPVVQSASFSGKLGASVAVMWSSEPGWSVSQIATGQFQITFPTSAPAYDEQSIQVQWWVDGALGVFEFSESVWDVTTNSCKVMISSDTGVEDDHNFFITRRLADVSTPAGGVTLTRQVRTLLHDLTPDVNGEFDFAIPSGYDRIIIQGYLRSVDSSATVDNVRAYLNGDTTQTNYFGQNGGGSNGSSLNTENTNDSRFLHIPTTNNVNSVADVYCHFETVLEGPDVVKKQMLRSVYGMQRQAANAIVNQTALLWTAAAQAITTMKLVSVSTDDLEGAIKVYGEKQEAIGGGGTDAERVFLEEIENTTAGEFDFASIPQGYNRLYIKGYIRGDAATTTETAHMYFNADTTDANYLSQRSAVQNGSASTTEQAEPEIAVIPGASSTAGSYAQVDITIEGYAGSVLKGWSSSFSGRSDAAGLWAGTIYGSHDSMTAALTQIQVRTDNHATDQLLGKLRLYGER